MREKLSTAKEAARLIRDGMHVGLGAGMEMNPMPVVREVIRNRVKDLTITPVIKNPFT